MRTQTSLFIHEENREAIISRFPGLAPIFKAGLQSIMIVPLIVKNDVIGVMNIQMAKPNAYTEMDLRLAERVSSQVAGAIANTLLFVEHKRSEEALRVSEERYRSILESIEDGYYEVDIAGNFTFFNDSMCQILGYSKEEMMGMNNRQYTDQKNAKKLYQAFNKVFRTEQSAKGYEWEIIKKDGTKRDVDASVSLIKDISGNRIGFRGIVRDIAERKQAEKEMAALQEQLRQSQKIEAIGQLAGGIAHDFNNAITLIKTCSQLALMDLKPGDPLRQTFEMIDKATQQSANLTRQLLAFSRRQIMEMKVLDLNSLLGDMDKMLHRVIGEDIELVSMLAGDLGRVKVDPGQMEQVVLNLVLNSRDAMPQGGKLTIETANVELNEKYVNNHVGVKPGSYVRVSVSDTGVGMTPEVRERVFEPFFTTKEKGKGTGLGLSTVYGIVKQSKGNIWVYSEPGKGTTFKVYLPQVEEPLEEEKEKARRLERELPHGGETVLVAEDDGDVRSLVVQILKKQGYKVL
ncbi:MAG: PAS domain S-box protein, partial [Deltaproteobacteria bacterium]|nr:PAS domain S-box protein [Deltaproteobacteria bacterium]